MHLAQLRQEKSNLGPNLKQLESLIFYRCILDTNHARKLIVCSIEPCAWKINQTKWRFDHAGNVYKPDR
jgi:hypothetical protein